MNKQNLQVPVQPQCIVTTYYLGKQLNTTKTTFMNKVLQSLMVAFLFLVGLSNVGFGQTSNTPASGTAVTTAGNYYFTVPAGVSSMTISCYGAGGGSGGCGNTYNQAGGGSSGGAVQYTLTGLTAGEIFYYTVGTGGTGAAACTSIGVNGGGNGGNGGATIFGTATGIGPYTLGTTIISATGGNGSIGTGFSASGTSSSVYRFTPDFAIDSTAILNYFKYKRLLDLFSLNIKNYAYSRKIFSNTRLFCN